MSVCHSFHGDDWRTGVAAIIGANDLRANANGSPLIYAGTEIILPSLAGLDTAALGREGGAIIANNTRGLEAAAARQAAATPSRGIVADVQRGVFGSPSGAPLGASVPPNHATGESLFVSSIVQTFRDVPRAVAEPVVEFFRPLGDGVTLFAQGEAEGVIGVGSSRAEGRFFAVVPHERGFDIQWGGFNTVGAVVGADAGVSIGVGGHIGNPQDDLAGLAWAGELDLGYGTAELGRTDTGRTIIGGALSVGTPLSASGGRTNTTLTSFHSVQDALDPVVLMLEQTGRDIARARRTLSTPWWSQ